jgi:hypothetical protein
MPDDRGGLLGRLDTLTEYIQRRNGLQLAPDGVLTRAETASLAAATGLPDERANAETALLLTLGLAVGVLRADGLRVTVGQLHAAWQRLDDGLRAGLIYAAWCHRVAWPRILGDEGRSERLQQHRDWVLRRLHGLPVLVDVGLPGLVQVVAEHTGLPDDHMTARHLSAAFLDPLVGLGVAELDPPAPVLPHHVRLGLGAPVVISSALVACGEELPLSSGPCMS